MGYIVSHPKRLKKAIREICNGTARWAVAVDGDSNTRFGGNGILRAVKYTFQSLGVSFYGTGTISWAGPAWADDYGTFYHTSPGVDPETELGFSTGGLGSIGNVENYLSPAVTNHGTNGLRLIYLPSGTTARVSTSYSAGPPISGSLFCLVTATHPLQQTNLQGRFHFAYGMFAGGPYGGSFRPAVCTPGGTVRAQHATITTDAGSSSIDWSSIDFSVTGAAAESRAHLNAPNLGAPSNIVGPVATTLFFWENRERLGGVAISMAVSIGGFGSYTHARCKGVPTSIIVPDDGLVGQMDEQFRHHLDGMTRGQGDPWNHRLIVRKNTIFNDPNETETSLGGRAVSSNTVSGYYDNLQAEYNRYLTTWVSTGRDPEKFVFLLMVGHESISADENSLYNIRRNAAKSFCLSNRRAVYVDQLKVINQAEIVANGWTGSGGEHLTSAGNPNSYDIYELEHWRQIVKECR